MARKNRLVVADGWYHITARAHGRMSLLKDGSFKERIVDWIYGIAGFSGLEVGAWTVMDNHVHLVVRVPPVPEALRTDPARTPPSWAFGMRPAECRAPRWLPEEGVVVTPAGDSPSREAFARAHSDGVPLVLQPRPPVGFTLSDEALLARLELLYGGHSRRAAEIAEKWRRLRRQGRDDLVEAEKEAFCRRMYNISQFAKTLFQRISEAFNRETGHTGHFWESRFGSVLIDPTQADRVAVAAYVALNPVRAKMVESAADYAFGSYALASRGDSPLGLRCRRGFELMLGCAWDEADGLLRRCFSDSLPPELEGSADATHVTVVEDGKARRVPLRITQAVRMRQRAFTRGAVFTHDPAFERRVRLSLPVRFPAVGDWAQRLLSQFDWTSLRVAASARVA